MEILGFITHKLFLLRQGKSSVWLIVYQSIQTKYFHKLFVLCHGSDTVFTKIFHVSDINGATCFTETHGK